MAIRLVISYSCPSFVIKRPSEKVVRRSRGLMMCSKNSSNNVQIRSFDLIKKNKVFEDRAAGIVCYKDENGEITCEGYDEGPRFHQNISIFSRDVEIVDLLQRCWIHGNDKENEMEMVDQDRSEHKDFNCNRLNKLC